MLPIYKKIIPSSLFLQKQKIFYPTSQHFINNSKYNKLIIINTLFDIPIHKNLLNKKNNQIIQKMSKQQISAAEQLMKLAINNQNHVDSLIGYYRDLIDSYNDERAEWVLHYNNLSTTAEDQYFLQKQLNHGQAHLVDLSQNLSLKKAELTAQRQRYFKLLENNGNLKKRLQESKLNYRELMNTCKPVGLNNKQINSSSLLNSSKHQNSKYTSVLKETNPKTTQLELQLINTNKQHLQKKSKLKQKNDRLKAQLGTLLGQYQDRQDLNQTQYERQLQKLWDLQKKHMTLTSQYFRYRNTNSSQQKRIEQQNQIIRLKNLAILQKLKNLQREHSQQFKNIDTQVKKQNKKFKTKYDEELKNKQEHLTILKQQYERIQDIYLNKIKKLDQELRTTNQKLKSTEDKSKVEISSLKSQIKILKARLQKQGLHEIRRQIANQEEQNQSSQSLEISQLQKINQQVKNLQRQLNSK